MTITNGNYYCSQKFWSLLVNLEKSVLQSCCASDPEKIDTNWLKKNPGDLFNTPNLRRERTEMLNNIPVKSCEDNCWKPEKHGLTSRRIQFESYHKTHTSVESCFPKMLTITLGSACNLTCSYCCKQYSTAWLRDIDLQGPYLEDQRFKITPQEKILLRINHHDMVNSDQFNYILDQLAEFEDLDSVLISGGEPFLYRNLPELVARLEKKTKEIIVYTGLGIGGPVLKKQISKIQNQQNLKISVSAENCDRLYEFNRFGISYQSFLKNLDLLIGEQFDISFSSTLSNLTIFGFCDFYTNFSNRPIEFNLCNDPSYLGVNVLDDQSKKHLVETIALSTIPDKEIIISNISQGYTPDQHLKFSNYFREFSKRRNLDCGIFPRSMLDWIGV